MRDEQREKGGWLALLRLWCLGVPASSCGFQICQSARIQGASVGGGTSRVVAVSAHRMDQPALGVSF